MTLRSKQSEAGEPMQQLHADVSKGLATLCLEEWTKMKLESSCVAIPRAMQDILVWISQYC